MFKWTKDRARVLVLAWVEGNGGLRYLKLEGAMIMHESMKHTGQ